MVESLGVDSAGSVLYLDGMDNVGTYRKGPEMDTRNPFDTLREDPFEDDGRTGAPDDSRFAPPAFDVRADDAGWRVALDQLNRRGFAVWTSPTASLESDRRARQASWIESGYRSALYTDRPDGLSTYARQLDRQANGAEIERGW